MTQEVAKGIDDIGAAISVGDTDTAPVTESPGVDVVHEMQHMHVTDLVQSNPDHGHQEDRATAITSNNAAASSIYVAEVRGGGE